MLASSLGYVGARCIVPSTVTDYVYGIGHEGETGGTVLLSPSWEGTKHRAATFTGLRYEATLRG